MDDIRPPKFSASRPQRSIHDGPLPARPHARPAFQLVTRPLSQTQPTPAQQPADSLAQKGSITIKFTVPGWIKNFHPFKAAKSHLPKRVQRFAVFPKSFHVRVALAVTIIVLLVTEVIPIIQPNLTAKSYALEGADSLLQKTSQTMASKLVYDAKNAVYNFNQNYIPTGTAGVGQGGALITAVAHADASKGIDVSDPVSNVDFGLKPKFAVRAAKQEQNRLEYPLANGSGWLIYTFQAGQVKEDIILSHKTDNAMKFSYDLDLGDSLRAQLLKDGSLGIYGSSLPLNGQISTGSDKDAKLLDLARKKAVKDTLLFTVPAPVIKETGKTGTKVASKFVLKGSELTVETSNLESANYPLTIDPSVYVKSAQKLMRGNNETNVDFDVTNNQILKGSLTGARIPDWSAGPNDLPAKVWNGGTAVSGGYIYVVGGNNGTSNLATVYWAKFDTSTAQTIGAWTTNTGYNLPSPRSGMSVVAYDGYLFVLGGQNSSCTGTNAVCNTVYSSKLGANGEPNAWATIGNLSTESRYAAAVAYENRMYLYGGQTNASTANGAVNTAQYAEINPDGTLGTWTSTTALSTATYGLSAVSYNGYVYAVGGNQNSTTPVATVQYAKITSSGLGTWNTTSAFASGRQTFGSSLATVWNGYIYLSGGCATVTTAALCNSIKSDTQVASINADGSLATWTGLVQDGTTSSALALSKYGGGFIAWRGALYYVGGCTANMTATNCTSAGTSVTTSYGIIYNDGDVGPAQTTTTLPALTSAGRMAQSVVINNGYIYNIGGCAALACGTASTGVYYAAIGPNGSIGAWNATTALPATRATAGIAVYNNYLYVIGGTTGASGGAVASAYSAAITSTGTVGAWASTANVMASTTMYPFSFARVNPANTAQGFLYAIGGCVLATGSTGAGCSTYKSDVRRCTITNSTGAISGCATSATMPLPNTGIGIFGGAVYGDYIYLAGGANGGGAAQTSTVYYAKIDGTGTIVQANGATVAWLTTTASLTRVRRRTTAYAVNGYLYVLGGHDGTVGNIDTLNDIQIGKINAQTGDVTGNTTPTLFDVHLNAISARWDFRGAAANGYMYALGGCEKGDPPASCNDNAGANTGLPGRVEYLQVYNNSSGSPAAYNTTTVPTANAVDRIGGSSAVSNGRIYVAGGCTNIGCTTFTNTVESAPINADGTIGTWVTTNSMGATRTFFTMLPYNGKLYAAGGQSGTAISTALSSTEVGTINAGTGAVTWAAGPALSGTNPGRSGHDSAIYNGYFYVAGGQDATGAYRNTIDKSAIDPSTGALGTFSTTGNSTLPTARSGLSIVMYNSTMYMLGGYDGTNYLLDVEYAKISSTGVIAAFNPTNNLPQPVRQGSAFAANGYLYVVAGRSAAATCTTNTYIASISANSTIANGNNPNGLGGWSQTSVNFTTARYGAATTYSDGKVYILGGGCAALAASTDRAFYATLQSQPQIAKYSFVIDTDSDVFPSKTLFNGLDNGIGASWQLSYRSSTDAASAWGLNTNYGSTALGTPQAYVPINAGGTGTNFSRYHFIELTIDVSQAFGYPEDISRGPTITDYTFQFSADPSKRLRNGKTFTGGEQQPLDTPF
jgi:N-acetylneuraminic acid mutarotase